MGWHVTGVVEPYAAAAWALLARDPVQHTVALSVIASVRAGHRWSEHMWFAYYDDGTVRGAVSLTPPFELLLAVVPEDTLDELIDALRRDGVRFPGINGATETVERFVARWTSVTGTRAVPVLRMRLYRLGTLRWPERTPAGGGRPARPDDLEIAPVYPPPGRRRRGYGTAVTTACTHDALARGAEHLVLFTDLANPTSNSIYQQLGYRPVRDFARTRFTAS
jgi:hypothetical protein